jgi:hypothetical protein
MVEVAARKKGEQTWKEKRVHKGLVEIDLKE